MVLHRASRGRTGARSWPRVLFVVLFYLALIAMGYLVYDRFDSDDDITPEDPQLETPQWN